MNLSSFEKAHSKTESGGIELGGKGSGVMCMAPPKPKLVGILPLYSLAMP